MKFIHTAALLLALGSISAAPLALADHHEKGAAHDCQCDKDCSEKCSKHNEGEHCEKCHKAEGKAKEGECEHCKKGDCKDGACDLHKKKKAKKSKAAAGEAKPAEKKAEQAAPAASH